MFYGSNPYRKDNPRWAISNATVTPKVPDTALQLLPPVSGPRDHPVAGLGGGIVAYVTRAVGDACGIGVSWLIGLPRRAGTRLYTMTDAEARWWRWQVTERWGGLVHQYRDARFEVLRHNSAILREELRAELAGQDPAPPDRACPGDR